MGVVSYPLRILAGRLGSYLTCSSLSNGRQAVEGHTDPQSLNRIYRYHEIDTETRIFAVIGNPIMHSFSPHIHNRGYALLDINAVYRPLNDIEVEGRKLIPSSARLEKGILTMRLLINVLPTNQDLLKRALKTPIEKIEDKKIKDVAARFTWLEKEAGRKTDASELEALTRRTIEKVFGREVTLVPGKLSPLEKDYAAEYQKKYTSDPWFYANSERMRFKEIPSDALKTEGRHKALAGLIRVTLLIFHDKIHDLIITGDFHPTPYGVLKDMEDALRGKGCDIEIVEEEIQRIFSRPDVEIAGTEVGDFVSAFRKAFDQAQKEAPGQKGP